VQAPLAQISWYHNITLLQKCPDETKRFWYAAAALENGWSRDVLVHHRSQVEVIREQMKRTHTNAKKILPFSRSNLFLWHSREV